MPLVQYRVQEGRRVDVLVDVPGWPRVAEELVLPRHHYVGDAVLAQERLIVRRVPEELPCRQEQVDDIGKRIHTQERPHPLQEGVSPGERREGPLGPLVDQEPRVAGRMPAQPVDERYPVAAYPAQRSRRG